MTITIAAPRPEDAQLILRAAHDSDRSSVYTHDMRAVSGSVITARWRPDERAVEVASNCISSLETAFEGMPMRDLAWEAYAESLPDPRENL